MPAKLKRTCFGVWDEEYSSNLQVSVILHGQGHLKGETPSFPDIDGETAPPHLSVTRNANSPY